MIVLLPLAGCTHTAQLTDTAELVEPYSYGLQSAERPAPYLERFEKDGKKLTYLASRHANERSSRTFALIDEVLSAEPVKLVIIEGVKTSLGNCPAKYLESAAARRDGDFYGGGEPSYAAWLSKAKGIPFVGGEPDEKEVVRTVLAQGYTPEDLLGFYFVRQYPQLLRDRTIERRGLKSAYDRFMPAMAKEAGLERAAETFTLAKFKAWYGLKNGKRFRPELFDPEEAAPLAQGHYLTQRISAVVSWVRNRWMVTLFRDELVRYGNVFAIFGSGHLTVQRKALEAMLGAPRR